MDKKGFTLIEVLITIGIIAIVAFTVGILDTNSFRGESFRSEINIIGTALQTARANSMNNINQKKHGVAFHPNGQNKYVIYEGDDYTSRDANKDIDIASSYTVTFDITSPTEISFEQLRGDANFDGDISITDPNRNFNLKININHEGKIAW